MKYESSTVATIADRNATRSAAPTPIIAIQINVQSTRSGAWLTAAAWVVSISMAIIAGAAALDKIQSWIPIAEDGTSVPAPAERADDVMSKVHVIRTRAGSVRTESSRSTHASLRAS